MVGSVPRRIVPELRNFNWLLKINNQLNWRNLTDSTCSVDVVDVGEGTDGYQKRMRERVRSSAYARECMRASVRFVFSHVM